MFARGKIVLRAGLCCLIGAGTFTVYDCSKTCVSLTLSFNKFRNVPFLIARLAAGDVLGLEYKTARDSCKSLAVLAAIVLSAAPAELKNNPAGTRRFLPSNPRR